MIITSVLQIIGGRLWGAPCDTDRDGNPVGGPGAPSGKTANVDDFNTSAGTKPYYNSGKDIYDGSGNLVYDGDSASATDNLVTGLNTKITHNQAMADTAEIMGMEAEYTKEMMALNFEYTQQAIDTNIARFPSNAKKALVTAKSTGSELSEAMKTAFEGALNSLYPDWREDITGAAGTAQKDSVEMTELFKKNVLPKAMAAADEMSAQALDNVNAQLRGDIPDDVAEKLKRHAAEISQQIGVRGQAAKFLTARDLGRTSYDIMRDGLEGAPAALGLGANAYTGFTDILQNPVKTGTNVTNLIKAYMAPQADLQGMFNTNAAVLSGASVIPPSTAMQVGAQLIGSVGQLTQNAFTNSLEYNSQQYWNGQNLIQQKNALSAQESAGKMGVWGAAIGAVGAVAGGVVGGPMGAAAGAAIGGAVSGG